MFVKIVQLGIGAEVVAMEKLRVWKDIIIMLWNKAQLTAVSPVPRVHMQVALRRLLVLLALLVINASIKQLLPFLVFQEPILFKVLALVLPAVLVTIWIYMVKQVALFALLGAIVLMLQYFQGHVPQVSTLPMGKLTVLHVLPVIHALILVRVLNLVLLDTTVYKALLCALSVLLVIDVPPCRYLLHRLVVLVLKEDTANPQVHLSPVLLVLMDSWVLELV
jgi:hypothetical protein